MPLNPPRCPKCNSLNNNNLLNITNEHFFPRNNFNFRIRRPQFRRIFYNDLTNNSRHSAPNLDDSSDDQDFDNFEDEDINSDDDLDLDIKSSNGLNQEIIDNMEISKIKDVEKLDSDKKKCTICLEDYVNGDNSIALPCIHIFHADCIKTWLKNQNTCPICKFEIKYEIEDIENNLF